ncbi:RNA polymerase sigma factor [Sphingomonas immobilis]|uniref:Sigma-70 family RNA polymerase sigma factor n=1 Tax=Sphingomonas immobilis TaxID=3063997 RepID=A0ABT9A184_9SPHN|nr:sigma-70 family RNA polymerase sigma factor [Sphingomonas sp. CA1-15]MDO7843597.1 sigma-70 family RNA polymerase sigma factor [Sphingomonas sp. CA1-15]
MGLSKHRSDLRLPLAEDDPIPPGHDRVVADVPSIDALYRAERPRLLRFLGSRSGDEAGDIVQRTFVRFSEMPGEKRSVLASPAGYLRRIAANLSIDNGRKNARTSKLDVPFEDVELVAPDQVAALEARDMLRRLEVAIQRLKPRTREIFLAHRVDGYSYAEIAARTGLSVKCIEKHMSRAIAYIDRVLSAR